MGSKEWKIHNASGSKRVIVTKELPGDRWLNILTEADCKIEICASADVLSSQEIKAAFGDRCDAAIGQLTEPWGDDLFAALKAAGGTAYSNYAVGFNNVDVACGHPARHSGGQHAGGVDRDHRPDGGGPDLCSRPPGR